MKKAVSLLLAALLLLALVPFACADMEVPKSPIRLSVGGGSSGGNFYVVAGGVATLINNALPEYFNATGEETGGSTANLVMIDDGEIEFGVSMTSSIQDAIENGNENVRGMIALYPSYLTIYTMADSGINSLQDIAGHVVGLGSQGAAMDNVWRQILADYAIEPKMIFNDGHAATATAMKNGDVDVAVLYSLPPFAAIAELEAGSELNFIGLTEEEQADLCAKYSFYSPAVMPAGSYKGVKEDIPVVSEWNMLVTSREVDEEIVYLITKTLLENNAALVETYKGLTYATAENILNYNCPLHTGVIRYLSEIGIEVPAELIPAEYAE